MIDCFVTQPEALPVAVARIALLIALLTVAAGCRATEGEPPIDMGREPQTLSITNPFEIGERYTLGMTGSEVALAFPIRITGIDLIAQHGIEVVGVGAFDPEQMGSGIGLVPGWPPEGYQIPVRDDETYTAEWQSFVYTLVGIEVKAVPSGLRGVRVSWVDATGASHAKDFDIAVLTCPPGECADDAMTEQALLDVGLVLP